MNICVDHHIHVLGAIVAIWINSMFAISMKICQNLIILLFQMLLQAHGGTMWNIVIHVFYICIA
jgi:hypothetical protein